MTSTENMTIANVTACLVCHKLGAKLCGRCRQISYCSSTCQLTDWPIHKQFCNANRKPEAQLINFNPLIELQTKKSELWARSVEIMKKNTESIYIIDSKDINETTLDKVKSNLTEKSYEFLSNTYKTKEKNQVVIIIRHGLGDGQIFITRIKMIEQ